METIQKKILIADDDEPFLRKLSENIKIAGYIVLEARNGKEAMKIAGKSKPNVIILDLLMPLTDGVTMLQNLKTTQWGKYIPIILLTTLQEYDPSLQKILKLYSAYYKNKSLLQIDDIINTIKNVLSHHNVKKLK